MDTLLSGRLAITQGPWIPCSEPHVSCRQGMGVTGGTPMGFDVGAVGPGGTLKGLDLVRP